MKRRVAVERGDVKWLAGGLGVLTLVALITMIRLSAPRHEKWPGGVPPGGVPAADLVARPDAEATVVPLVRLLATPGVYDGRVVMVVGFVNLEFEGDSLYCHREDFEAMLLTNRVRLDVPASAASFRKFNRRYVIVTGVFDASATGRDVGEIGAISRFDPVPSRADFVAHGSQ